MKKDIKKILGLSILEALVSTAIIGIGFVAILQMTNYSVQSIYSSGERTNFSDFLASDEGKSEINLALDFCNNASAGTSSTNTGNVYGDSTTDGHLMKTRKWEALLNNKSYLNCKGTNERKNIEVFKISSTYSNMKIEDPDNPGTFLDEGMPNDNTRLVNGVEEPYVKDDLMYIGRVQMNLNDVKKRKFLYFQTDYFLKN